MVAFSHERNTSEITGRASEAFRCQGASKSQIYDMQATAAATTTATAMTDAFAGVMVVLSVMGLPSVSFSVDVLDVYARRKIREN